MLHAPAAKGKKQHPTPLELDTLVRTKISQLETENSMEEVEEKALAKSIRKAGRDLMDAAPEDNTAKYAYIYQKYMDLLHDMKRLERETAKSKKRLEIANKEKESVKSECHKATIMKGKLESVCRQLQKENKRIKDESRNLATVEQQKREELSTKFESTIVEIKSKMQEDTDEKRKRMDDSEILRDKFQSFLDQYELREKHFRSVVKAKDLELQLAEAKMAKQRGNSQVDFAKVSDLHDQINVLAETEIELRKQLGVYVDKFKQVEDTLNKSNELFTTFRKEMEEMTKRTKKLERDNGTLRVKCDTMNRNILEMAEEQTKARQASETYEKRRIKLENLCRALQAERGFLKKKVDHFEKLVPDLAAKEECGTDRSEINPKNSKSNVEAVKDDVAAKDQFWPKAADKGDAEEHEEGGGEEDEEESEYFHSSEEWNDATQGGAGLTSLKGTPYSRSEDSEKDGDVLTAVPASSMSTRPCLSASLPPPPPPLPTPPSFQADTSISDASPTTATTATTSTNVTAARVNCPAFSSTIAAAAPSIAPAPELKCSARDTSARSLSRSDPAKTSVYRRRRSSPSLISSASKSSSTPSSATTSPNNAYMYSNQPLPPPRTASAFLKEQPAALT